MSVRFHPAAVLEAQAARRWYSERDPGAADRFMVALGDAISRISERPLAWPPFEAGTRRILLKRFPYQLIYRTTPRGATEVVAVMHERRRPGYWRDR